MASQLNELGRLIRAHRLRLNLTQEELARQLTNVNRSLIAHLEQGRRLPPAPLLEQIARFLEIPDALWEPFTKSGFQRFKTQPLHSPLTVAPFRLLAVSGIAASGKSTLAEQIAAHYGVEYVAEASLGLKYLADLARDPARWALEAQLAFLVQKTSRLGMLLRQGKAAVLDRSLAEDAFVYARHFVTKGEIPARSAEVYRTVVDFFMEVIPPPDLHLVCLVSEQTALQRVLARGRDDTGLQSPEFVHSTYSLFQEWLATSADGSFFTVDSEEIDWRNPEAAQLITHDLDQILREQATARQMDLFATQVEAESQTRVVQKLTGSHLPRIHRAERSTHFAPVAYVAAPFTSMASTAERPGTLLSGAPHHGSIHKGAYRSLLQRIERELRRQGLHTILPHRDVNRWGRRPLSPRDAMQECTMQVGAADLLVAILGKSNGAHYEFGLARGLGKPCVVLHCSWIEDSFLATGAGVLQSDPGVLELDCERPSDILPVLRSRAMQNFLSRNLEVRKRSD